MKTAEAAGIKIITNGRNARPDTSVTPQILKIIAARPGAVLTGSSGFPGVLPHLAPAERGFRGLVYSRHAVINAEFVGVGAAAVEGVIAPTGPMVVAKQLPDSNPIKAEALRFRELYEKANGTKANDAFAAYAYDAFVVMADAVRRAAPRRVRPGRARWSIVWPCATLWFGTPNWSARTRSTPFGPASGMARTSAHG